MSVSDSERGRLGDLLEDLVGDALDLLKRLGRIKDYRDLRPTVREFAHKARENAYPDWWVLLLNNQSVEIECKNLSKRPKKYLRKPTDSPFWAYDYNWMMSHLTKVWTKGSNKVLVVSTMHVFTPGTQTVLRTKLDGVVEAGSDQITKVDTQIRDSIAVDLYEYFEKWVGEDRA
jgi:hypothetical protein